MMKMKMKTKMKTKTNRNKLTNPVRIELYKKCMKYLTFLDYPTVESVGKDFESKLEEQEVRHQEQMKQVNEKYDQIIDAMSKNPILSKVKTDVLKKKIKKK